MRFPLPRWRPMSAAAVVVVVLLTALAAPASAHNSLESTEPASSSVLSSPLAALRLRFANPTPLDTVQVELIDSSGTRSTVAGLMHGSSDREVVVTVAPELTGEVTYRWRLVGSDGHVVSGRVQLTLAAATPVQATDAAATTRSAPLEASGSTDAAAMRADPPSSFSAPFSTPQWARWWLRVLAFISIVLLAGATATALYVWPGGGTAPRLRAMTSVGVVLLELTAALQFAILASDISGNRPLTSLRGASTALGTDAGKALVARIALCGGLAAVLLTRRFSFELDRWLAVAATLVLAVATFSVAGHARSMRWSWLGVPLDVSHMVAASVWLGGLVTMAVVVMPVAADELVPAVRRFAVLALASVAVVGASGLLQSLRLLGSPLALASTGHGRLLFGKLVVLAGMLLVADVNRRRVERRFRRAAAPGPGIRWALSRAMLTESVFGAAVLAVTAALVVSPPGVSKERSPSTAASTSSAGRFDRVLSSGAGQIRLQIERTDGSDTGPWLITVVPLGATNPQRITVRASGLMRDAPPTEVTLAATPSGQRGSLNLPSDTPVRMQVVLDNDVASSFVATVPSLV